MTDTAVDLVPELTIDADAQGLARASSWLEKTGREHGMPAEQIRRLDLCLNESIANIIAHGGHSAAEFPVQLRFQVRSQPGANEASLTVSDAGIAFDPLAHHSKPRPKTLAETNPGGLGLMMMREFSDSLSYCYRDGRNRTTFTVHWDKAE